MSNNSWKQYGGQSKMDNYNVINASTIVAEQFVSRSTKPIYQFLNGIFEVSMDLSAGINIIAGNSIYSNVDLFVNKDIYSNNKIYFGGNTFVNSYGNNPDYTFPARANDSTHAYLYGDASFVGVNTVSPETNFHITATIPEHTDILTIENQNTYIRNIMTQNKNKKGMVMDADDTSCNIHFFIDNSTNSLNNPNATIKCGENGALFTNSNIFQVDTSGGTIYMDTTRYTLDNSFSNINIDNATGDIQTDTSGQFIIHTSGGHFLLNENKALLSSNGHIELHASGGYVEVDANGGEFVVNSGAFNLNSLFNFTPPLRGLSGELYNETITIYDNSNSTFLPNVYNINGLNTGNALVGVGKDPSSNTFMRLVPSTSLQGSAYGGGLYPYDWSRAMNLIGLNDICGNFVPNQTLLEGNNKAKYVSTLGINTFMPKTEQYVVDMNGPLRIANGEINTVAEAHFEIKNMSFSKTHPNCGITVGTPSTLFDDNNDASFKQNLLYTNNGGISWNLSDIYQQNINYDNFDTSFNAVYMYDDKYGFFGGTNGNLFFTNDGGNSIYKILGGVSENINCVVACKVDNDNIKLVIAHNDNKISYTNSIPFSGLDTPTQAQGGDFFYSTTIATTTTLPANTITECHSNNNVIYFVGNGITKYTINTDTINEITNNNSYNNIFVSPDTNPYIIAVGYNIISYVSYPNNNSVPVWNDVLMNNSKNITDVFMIDDENKIDDKKIVIIGEDGYFAYTINGPAAPENWITVPDSILNSSGMAQRITSNENKLKRLFMPDNNTLIIANVITPSSNTTDNSNDIVGYSKILYVFLPALFNRDNNTVLDICGNMMVSGNINSIDGRLYVGQNSTFNGDVLMNNNLVIENNATIKKRFTVYDFISENDMLINTKDFTLNAVATGPETSKYSGVYIRDNDDSKAGHILVQDNMNGFKFKAPSVGSQSVCLETEKLKITDSLSYNSNLGINSVNNAIMTLNRRFDTTNINAQTDASYSIAVSQFDISNVLVRDSNTSNDTIQDIKTELIVQQDVSFNQNLRIGKDLTIDGNLSVQQYSNDTIIHTTSHNYDFLTVAEDMSLNGRFFVRDDVSMNSNLFVQNKSILNGDVSMNSHLFINGDVSMNSHLFINGDVSMNNRLFINGDVSLNSNLYTSGTVGIGIHNPFVSFDISKNDAIKIPKGTTGERPVANNADESHRGYIRYNTDINQFEGYGAGSNWSSLGGVTNVAKNTKIIAEDEPAATNNDLIFYTAEKDADEEGDKKERMRIDASGNIGIHSNSPIVIFDISGTDALHIPKGQTGDRPIKNTGGVFTDKNNVVITAEDMEKYQGCIRYNYNTSQFEGFGPGNNWGSLGGVVNVAQNTKIIAEDSPASTNNQLMFFTAPSGSSDTNAKKERMRIDANGNIGIGYANPRCTLDISGVVNIGPTAPHENVLPWTMTMIDDREFDNDSNPKYNNNLLYIGKNSWFNNNVNNVNNVKILLNNIKNSTNPPSWNSHGKIAWVGGKDITYPRQIEANISAWIDCVNNVNGDLKDTTGCIVFATSNVNSNQNPTERMRIHANGNVGIGTNDPKTNLHINHDFHIAANNSASNDNVGKGIYMRYSTNNTEDAAYIQSVDRTQNPDAYHPMYMQASHFYFNDEVDATSFNAVSDIRHKENICDLENALEKINTIRGVKFNFKDNDKIHAGIIAQEVAPIMPELINKDNDDKWSANYDGLIPYLIESVKTLTRNKEDMQHDIEELKRENEELKEKMTKYDLLFEQLLNK